MKKLISSILILICIPIEIFACTCGIAKLSELQRSEIENSECIFIGEIFAVREDLTYVIKVTESLDGGDSEGNIYIGKNWKACEPYVERNGKWLVYATMENGFLKMNMCGISRPFENPMVNPILPPKAFFEEGLNNIEKKKILADMAIENSRVAEENLKNEIIALRKLRDEGKKASR